jgi:hypothetical protein
MIPLFTHLNFRWTVPLSVKKNNHSMYVTVVNVHLLLLLLSHYHVLYLTCRGTLLENTDYIVGRNSKLNKLQYTKQNFAECARLFKHSTEID